MMESRNNLQAMMTTGLAYGGGLVVGMLLAQPSGSRKLPDEVRFALTVDAISGVMSQAGLAARQGTETASLAPEDITERGVGMTVLVSCWE